MIYFKILENRSGSCRSLPEHPLVPGHWVLLLVVTIAKAALALRPDSDLGRGDVLHPANETPDLGHVGRVSLGDGADVAHPRGIVGGPSLGADLARTHAALLDCGLKGHSYFTLFKNCVTVTVIMNINFFSGISMEQIKWRAPMLQLI